MLFWFQSQIMVILNDKTLSKIRSSVNFLISAWKDEKHWFITQTLYGIRAMVFIMNTSSALIWHRSNIISQNFITYFISTHPQNCGGGVYFYFGLSVCACVCMSVCPSVKKCWSNCYTDFDLVLVKWLLLALARNLFKLLTLGSRSRSQ